MGAFYGKLNLIPHLIRTNCLALSTCPWAGSGDVAAGQQRSVVEQHSLVFPLGMGLLGQPDPSACSQQCHRHHNSSSTAAAVELGKCLSRFSCARASFSQVIRKVTQVSADATSRYTQPPPGWEGFVTLWKKHPHHQKQIPQGKSGTVHRDFPEAQREGRHTTPAQSPFPPSEQG